MNNAEMPAYPHLLKAGGVAKSEGGLSKREHFAAMALPRIEVLGNEDDFAQTAKTVAQLSVALADALLEELEKDNA